MPKPRYRPASAATDVLALQRTIGNRAVARLLDRGISSRQPSLPHAPAAATGGQLLQRLYLWDRKRETEPHWTDEKEPPAGYLPSGQHDDGEHGSDDLYARMGDFDLFYGISYEDDERMEEFAKKLGKVAKAKSLKLSKPEGLTAALVEYEKVHGPPLLDVSLFQSLYGGSSGWDRYSSYLEGKPNSAWAKAVQGLNPGLPWAGNPAGLACQTVMISAVMAKGSVRFLLDGMENVKGIIEGTAYKGKITSQELRFAVALLGAPVNVPGGKVVTPVDGANVFFYVNHKLVPAARLAELGVPVTL